MWAPHDFHISSLLFEIIIPFVFIQIISIMGSHNHRFQISYLNLSMTKKPKSLKIAENLTNLQNVPFSLLFIIISLIKIVWIKAAWPKTPQL